MRSFPMPMLANSSSVTATSDATAATSVPPGLRPGVVIGGKYRIDGLLGSGGMGLILSATHIDLHAPVAIKVVRDELARNELIVSQLMFEARAAAQMRSAHVVRILDVGRLSTGAPYLVMEQLQGLDLDGVLFDRGMLPISEAISYMLQACEGLAEAHALGVVHRDLKPENLFLANTPEGPVLKILDFGVCKEVGPTRREGNRPTLSREGASVGSPFYMSPEQMRAAPNLDARADIWSLGAILFELVTGQCPFEAETIASLAVKVLTEDAPTLLGLLPGAPPELDAIIQRCLRKAPEERFQTVSELSQALREFAAHAERQSLVTVETDWVEPIQQRRASRINLALFSIGALLLGALGTFWLARAQAASALAAQAQAAEQHPAPRAPTPSAPAVAPLEGSMPPAPAAIAATTSPKPKPPPGGWKWPPEAKPTSEPSPTEPEPSESTSTRYGL